MELDKAKAWLEENLLRPQVHGWNIVAKLRRFEGLSSEAKAVLPQVLQAYREWMEVNRNLVGYSEEVIRRRVEALNVYKEAISKAPFSPQSKFHPSVIEEFLFYLFRDLIDELNQAADAGTGTPVQLGGTRAYSNLFFAPRSLREFIHTPRMRINEKDQDFTIYRAVGESSG